MYKLGGQTDRQRWKKQQTRDREREGERERERKREKERGGRMGLEKKAVAGQTTNLKL